MMMNRLPPFGSSMPSCIDRESGRSSLQDPVDPAGVAAPLGRLLALDRVQLLEDLDGNRQVVLLELEDRLGVVEQDVRIEHEGLDSGRYLNPRL